MLLEVTRGHIKVKIGEKTATLQGEMFFPGDNKIGFVLYTNSIKSWDSPNHGQPISPADSQAIIADIQDDFTKGGHILEIE
jgi:hypothetical protein